MADEGFRLKHPPRPGGFIRQIIESNGRPRARAGEVVVQRFVPKKTDTAQPGAI